MYAELMGNYEKQGIKSPCGNNLNLLEGRQYYDCFVFGAKADGVYVEVNTAASAATGAITPTGGATVKYTTDGSDPRYSMTAVVGTTPTVAKNDVVKAYQYKEGAYPSPVAEMTITGA